MISLAAALFALSGQLVFVEGSIIPTAESRLCLRRLPVTRVTESDRVTGNIAVLSHDVG